jgi:DNA-binding GntR family transcriptional regulator
MAASMQHTDLATAVTSALRESIIDGSLAPGQRLVETDLADRYDVSRGPIRDALAELERSGLVELRPRKGSFVRSLTATDVHEVYSLRIALESLALRTAIEAGTTVSDLAPLLRQLEAAHADHDVSAIGRADMALHRAIVSAAQHRRLLEAWESLADQTLLMMAALPLVDPEIQGPMGAHHAIVEALRQADADAAVAALAGHLTDAEAAMAARFTD